MLLRLKYLCLQRKDGPINAIIRNRIPNIDLGLLCSIPAIWLLVVVIATPEYALLISGLIASILIYEALTYRERNIYGLSGGLILSIPSIVVISFLVFIAVPSVYITISMAHPQSMAYYFAVLSFLPLFGIGLKFGKLLFPVAVDRMNDLYQVRIKKTDSDKTYYEALLVLLSINLGTMFLYFLRVKTIPLFELIRSPGTYSKLNMLRAESMKLLQVSFVERYMFSWQMEILFPIGIVASLTLFVLYRESRYRNLFIAFLLLGLFNNSLTIAKMPTAAIILMMMVYIAYYRQKIRFRFILSTFVIVLLFPYLIVYFVSIPSVRDPVNILMAILLRLFIIPAEVLFYYFKFFPGTHDFLAGRSSKFFAWYHPEGSFNTENYVMKQWWGKMDSTGYANAFYMGNFWADFGWYGIIFSTLVIGVFVHYTYQRILITSDYQKNIIYVTFSLAMLVTFSFSFISMTFTILLLTKGVMVALVLLLIIRYVQFHSAGKIVHD